MNSLDILLVILLTVGAAFGYYKGLIRQLTVGAGIFVGLLQAVWMWPLLNDRLQPWTGWQSWITIPLSFLLIVFAVVLLFALIGALLRAILKSVHMQIIDRVLGALFAFLLLLLLFVAGVRVFSHFDPQNKLFGQTSQSNSLFYKPVQKFSGSFLNAIRKKVNE